MSREKLSQEDKRKIEALRRKAKLIEEELRRLQPFIRKQEKRQDWWKEDGGKPPSYSPGIDKLPF